MQGINSSTTQLTHHRNAQDRLSLQDGINEEEDERIEDIREDFSNDSSQRNNENVDQNRNVMNNSF